MADDNANSPAVQAAIAEPPIFIEPVADARRTLVLAACLMGTFMAAVESTIVATAMPTIIADLHGFNLFSWVFTVYLLSQAVSIPVYGRLADLYGRKRMFFVGAGLFMVGSALCGFSTSMVQLVVFRLLQGFGAGGVQPVAMTILGDIYTPAEPLPSVPACRASSPPCSACLPWSARRSAPSWSSTPTGSSCSGSTCRSVPRRSP
jgi:hypothetical protein